MALRGVATSAAHRAPQRLPAAGACRHRPACVIGASAARCASMTRGVLQVMFLVKSVWHGVSALQCGVGDSGNDKGQHRRTAGLRLTRFDPAGPCAPANLVLLSDEEAAALQRQGLQHWCDEHPRAAAFVKATLARVESIF